MANVFKLIGVLLIIGAAAANVDDDVDADKDNINPLEILQEADDKERDERGILDMFKKGKPAAVEPMPANYVANPGYGIKTSYGAAAPGGYGAAAPGGYGVGYGGGYGRNTGSGYGGNPGLGYGSSSASSSASSYGSGPGYGYGASLSYGPGQISVNTGVKTHPHKIHPGAGHAYGHYKLQGNQRPNSNMYQRGQTPAQTNLNYLMGVALQLPQYGSCQIYVLPPNVERQCRNGQCDLTCRPGYKFPDGKTRLVVVCIGGTWTIKDSVYVTIPPCQATCLPPCQNNGVCLEPGRCQCPETYTGPYCEHRTEKCSERPKVPKNSRMRCDIHNTCTAECSPGFKFPDGSTITNIVCKNGQYIHTKTGQNKPPNCEPICTPECANGGTCITPGTCNCGPQFRGDRCQYSVNVCNVTQTNFNGNFKCAYKTTEATCVFDCYSKDRMTEFESEGRTDINYTCKYEQGVFLPKPYPKCIYPPGYTIRQKKVSSHYTQHEGNPVNTGGATYGYQYMTEHEKIIAIIAKYKEYDQKSEWWSSEETGITPNSYSLYVSGDVNVVEEMYPKPAFCTTWGGVNLKTFDGLVFKAPLSCSHTLINDKQDGSFSVILKGCPYGSGYGCAHTLKIYWESVLYTFENRNGTVHLYSPIKTYPTSARIKGMRLVSVAQHFIIELESFGLKIDWDLHQYVGIYASPALWSRVGGLCGSFDGDYKNDLMTKTGKVVETVKSFTDSWRVDDTSELCAMDNSAEIDFDTKSCDPEKRRKAIEVCERLLANEKLDECFKFFNFQSLVRTCVEDYCNCADQKHPETCNCDAMSMWAKECAFKGVKLEHGWRNLEVCPITCGFSRVYRPCGPDVELTCDSQDLEPTKGKCVEGCFCPEGTVQYKDTCITQELCPCVHGRREYKPGQTRKEKCNKCTCKNGKWKCTNETCGARCGAIGDPHYQTFDGKRYDFMGKCSYYLLKTANMSVEAENVACSGVISENLNLAAAENPSCTKSVTVKFVQRNGVPTSIKLHQGLITHVNGKEITKFPKILGVGEVLIRRASDSFLTVEFPGGIRVWWDGVSRVYIDAPPAFMGETAGLCGTFNSKTDDDFLTPEGDIETSVEAFADKWRTKDTCDFASDTALNPHPCTAHPEKKAEAEKYCSWIMDDIFQDCHWTVAPEQYYEDCLYDVCACKDDPAKCYCPILSAYGAECMRQGVKSGWRMAVKECAVKCPLGQVYEECGDNCALSCEDLSRRGSCKRECVEGCRCPHDEYLNEENECVPIAKCHCTYDGMSFNPGYKEVRPGSKFLDLCTCKNGEWDCEEAESGDDVKYPPSSELRAECAKRPFAQFSKCVAKEPKTCKNMHEYTADYEECVPGCECMDGYVYDMALKLCVLPEKCSCHHAGKSYSDGEKMKEDCNTCVCQAGNWKCSTNGCESTCSVWGDSHFSTFDSNEFDFQGECDYILSKGVANNDDGFTVTIQNVLCGTMGVTCSKSVDIALTGSIQDTLTLAGDTTYIEDPDKSVMNKLRDTVNSKSHSAFHVYRAGVFIVVEVPSLHLQIKWDEGTRVYLKLGNEWKNKVSGLCGNYNDNAMDDMKSPSQALEMNSLTFGHSWRVQKYCVMPTQPIDACKEHPERETWAQLKCGVLKSNLFKECHAEVPVEKYLKRCIFDTCACDQGGDCECLCTAVAAYAHVCSQKGINIRWRTPHFCPMQCDPHCAEYKACTPACPVETCDNFLEQSTIDHMCKTENCMEGCRIKPCDEGMIYSNDTYKECVPKSECKPVCMIKDGKTYYEGDVTYQDDCSTCRCAKKKEVCSGVKCAIPETTLAPVIQGTTLAPLKTEEQPKCIKGWTRWYDDDTDPSVSLMRLNDEEKLPRYDRMESIYGTCKREFMKKIECRVVNTHESSDFMNENVYCNLNTGLSCIGNCHDYEIRVFCECDASEPTTPKPTEKPQTGLPCNSEIVEYKEYPGDCHKFLHCSPRTDGGWFYVEKTCGESMMFNPTINVCDHIATVQEIKPDCKKGDTDIKVVEKCQDGQVWSECANQCEHSCHYYGMILRKRGLCREGEHCKPGCVDAKRPNCAAEGKYWRDENTCVELDECPCMDKTEVYVQPHMPFVGVSEVCQCIYNVYTCSPNVEEVETVTVKNVTVIDDKEGGYMPISVTPPAACTPELLIPLIQGSEPLPDSVFNATSSLGPNYLPHKARLLTDANQNSVGVWSPMINDQMQYLQITLPEVEPLYGVVVAGNPEFDNYVTLFKIFYSQDGEAYHLLTDETGQPQMFNGPLDSRSPLKSIFKVPVEARSVRIFPLKWHNSIAVRAELLGCDQVEVTTEIVRTTLTTEHPIVIEFESPCPDKMGVENGEMHPNQVKASSIWQLPMPAKKPRLIDLLKLSSPVGWKPMVNSPNEYVEFDFLEPRNISGFITKGGPDGWVSGYKVMFSKNKLIWNKALDVAGKPKIFHGNHDKDTEQANYFEKPILTQYIKLVPAKWTENINMRVEPIGCFKSYPIVSERVVDVEEPKPSKCNVCEGVVEIPSADGSCKCNETLFWDGSNCVHSNLCPCVENFLPYPIGSKFENKQCEECVCVLGGQSSCKAKKCPPCENKNLRPVVGVGCFCKCEPCPKHQRLCPSSGDCIPEVLWCNGVQDCEDDEDATCTDVITVTSKPIVQVNETEVITCPMPECPPKMKMKITEKKERKMSSMFTSTFTKKVTISREGGKTTKSKVITSSQEYSDGSGESGNGELMREEECEEFTCVPIKEVVIDRNQSVTCVEPKCPPKYSPEVDVSSTKRGECPAYSCILKPSKDDVCEISGKIFTTFDGTEFKYDTCSHVLARDLLNSSWVISVHLECTDSSRKICRKMITIKDLERNSVLIIKPKLRLDFNGFEYTVQQLINSPICKASFVISQVGDTVLVVSPKRGYWVLYDDIGYVKIGISSKFIKTVDGLCGYYDGIASNDKRTPNGTVLANTKKFGDSWFDDETPLDECYPQTCPLDLQKKALALCNTVKHPTFVKCGKSVNHKQFVTKCMETTCECLKANNGDVKTCKCNILQDFVKKCLSVNPNVQMNTWRAVHQCEISCPAPLVHADCYKRRCEPSCDSLNSDDCPIIPDACFSGCYCPEGTVRKGDTCVPIAECRDCLCNTLGSTEYYTYDRDNFAFKGNCSYLLSRDIVLPGVHTFQVYVTMDDCHKLGKVTAPAQSSCAKALHIINGAHVIHIKRMQNQPKVLQVLVDSFNITKMPYKDTWINLKEVPGKEIVLSLTEAYVEVKAAFEDLTFSIGVPSVKYASKMEGLCGDCDDNPNNDLQENPAKKKKGRKPSTDLADIIQSWKSDEPKLGLNTNECMSDIKIETEECALPPPEEDPCMMMLLAPVFGKCNMIVDPVPYISSCQKDMCKTNKTEKTSCEAITGFAKECSKAGICVDWRTAVVCPYECPLDQIYQPCGCTKSCDSLKSLDEFQAINMNTNAIVNTVTTDDLCPQTERYEGCFCPPGKVMEKGKCISEEMCVKCEDEDRAPGERWKKDKCTECLCDKNGKTQCVEQKCMVEENICAEGYVPQKKEVEGQCCPRYVCVPEMKPIGKLCLEPLMPQCGPGQFLKVKNGTDGCHHYMCECKPKDECVALIPPILMPGEKLVKDETGCCPMQHVICDKTLCPAEPEPCAEEFYEHYLKPQGRDCCPSYYCAPPKNRCIFEDAVRGKYTVEVTEKWVNPANPCKHHQCAYGPEDTTQILTTTEQCDTKCSLGFEYIKKDPSKCCGECVHTQCVLDGILYEPGMEWKSTDNCTTFMCVQKGEGVIVSSVREQCPDVSGCPADLLVPRNNSCCMMCNEEPVKEDLTNCLPVSLAESETRNMVKMMKPGHGYCINDQPIQGFTECMGSCNSGSKYNKATFAQDKICQCCNIKSYKTITVPLTCEDGLKVSKQLEIPASCGCQPCSDSVEYATANQIDIRLQPLPLAQMIMPLKR